MLVLWEEAQDQRDMSTEDSLRFLIASQVQDRREIQDLNEALETNNRNF
jgi:ferritin